MTDQTTLATQAEDLPHDTHLEHIRLTREWLLLFGSVGLGMLFIAMALAVSASAQAPLWIVLPLLTAFAIAAIGAMVTIRTLEYARFALHERFEQWCLNQETARKIAELQATQITNVSVKGRANVVSVNAGQRVEDVRLIPVNRAQATRLLDGVPECDLAYFCERAPLVGISKRAWLGERLPSNRTVNTFEIYDQIIQVMVKAGLIVGRAERSAGALASSDANELKARLGIGPGEIVKDVGPGASGPAT